MLVDKGFLTGVSSEDSVFVTLVFVEPLILLSVEPINLVCSSGRHFILDMRLLQSKSFIICNIIRSDLFVSSNQD